MDKKDVAKLLLEKRAVTLNPGQPYTFASGIKSPIYCDNRLLISYPDAREKIVDAFLKTIKENKIEFDIVAGTATAGIAWAAWISEKLKKPMVYIRSNAKEHGKGNAVEGKIGMGDKVLVIEDLISTGGSIIGAIDGVLSAKGIVIACLAIFTYEMESAKEKFSERNLPCYALTDFTTLIDTAVNNNYIGEEEKGKVLEWNKNPEEWGSKNE